MHVIYQIHDFCVNNFHYHNEVDGDYHWCNHYRTLVIACEVAVAMVDHNSNVDCHRTDDDCNVTRVQSHLTYFDDDNADAAVVVAAVDSMADNKSHLVNEEKLAPSELFELAN